jgi:outer membrane receptor for ferrienterochelin and colicins
MKQKIEIKQTLLIFIFLLISIISFSQADSTRNIEEMVVTGTLKELKKSDSPIPVEIISFRLLQKNPTPSIFDALGMVNGVKPQINCNVCNTGDIHINGMEGPYTLILIDGMPIVSGLSSVYGLSGIPTSLVDRIEIVKGPGSSLYGSDAMGGIINVITKSPNKTPLMSVDVFGTDWGEINTDIAMKIKVDSTLSSLIGINYYNFQHVIDKNKDGFTDLTLQNRISIFNKWQYNRTDRKLANLAFRYVQEDRWGGQTNWSKQWRGTDSIYGESIYTNRFEIIGNYQLPTKERIITQFSYNWHNQNSWYGNTPYMANQQVGFIQAYWDKKWAKHSWLIGSSMRNTTYDDNSPATSNNDGTTHAAISTIPGFFFQDEYKLNSKNTLLIGYRYDYNKHHGNIHSPRLAYKRGIDNHIIRLNFGTGFRVVNLFTEDHAALSGARKLIIEETLLPEKSLNSTLHYTYKKKSQGVNQEWEISLFHSYFTNKIIGDYLSNPLEIRYKNLSGYAVSQGVSINTDFNFSFPLKLNTGITYMEVFSYDTEQKTRTEQLHAPRWSGTLLMTYTFPNQWIIDLNGQWYGSMKLPIQPNDYRPENSPFYTILNLQVTKKWKKGISIYGGIKNILNFIPSDPIMRPFDPFNKNTNNPIENPNGYSFDPSYNYASLQGIRTFLGLRYAFGK